MRKMLNENISNTNGELCFDFNQSLSKSCTRTKKRPCTPGTSVPAVIMRSHHVQVVVFYAGLVSRSYRLRNKSSLQPGAPRFIAMPFLIAAITLEMAISTRSLVSEFTYLPNPEVQNPACNYKSERGANH